jgi:hypothetical protein
MDFESGNKKLLNFTQNPIVALFSSVSAGKNLFVKFAEDLK